MTWCTLSFRLLTPLAAIALGTACADGPNNGNLELSYNFGFDGNGTCQQFGVETVKVSLLRNTDATRTEEAPCAPETPILVDTIPSGKYDVLVQGIDANGVAVVDNVGGATDDDSVKISGGVTRSLETNLAIAPAVFKVKWQNFLDGDFAMCNFIEAKKFRVRTFRMMSTELVSVDFDCEVPPGFQTVPDPERKLDGTLFDSATFQPLDDNDMPLGDVLSITFQPPGPGQTIEWAIECNTTAAMPQMPTCTGMLTFPGGGGGVDSSGGSGGSGAADSGTGG